MHEKNPHIVRWDILTNAINDWKSEVIVKLFQITFNQNFDGLNSIIEPSNSDLAHNELFVMPRKLKRMTPFATFLVSILIQPMVDFSKPVLDWIWHR